MHKEHDQFEHVVRHKLDSLISLVISLTNKDTRMTAQVDALKTDLDSLIPAVTNLIASIPAQVATAVTNAEAADAATISAMQQEIDALKAQVAAATPAA